jgi:NAD(P)H-dependent flavin oxidoreductase YrpB (nitropropane dioxygenase family)
VNNQLCALTGAEFPLFAFSHCRDVVAAVSRAGGFGVLGGSGFTPEQLEIELAWIDAHVDGKPYGVDILVPEHLPKEALTATAEQLAAAIPARHRQFSVDLLQHHGVDLEADKAVIAGVASLRPEAGERLLDVAFRHPIRLIANALGIAPPMMIERGRQYGVPVAALVGAKEHALRQVQAGVDIIVAQGCEAGGHCGEVSTLVLVPEVVRAVKAVRPVPVLAAGGIVTGRQMAGCMAMGAQGVWTGSVWLATSDSEVSEAIRERLIAATSRDTVRSKARTGKPARQLRSAWHEAWDNSPASPGALPMPQMGMVSVPAFAKIDAAVKSGNERARALVSYFVGQGVGLIDSVKSARTVVQEFKDEFAEAVLELQSSVD